MTWAWIRPADPSALDGRPLLDLGCGDGQTLRTLVTGSGLAVGLDRSLDALRAARRSGVRRLVCADASELPFADGAFACVLAADLFHHLDDAELRGVLADVRRVMRDGGRLIAWWYERPGRGGPGAPRYPRAYGDVAEPARAAGLSPAALALELTLEPAPATAGIVATR